MKFRKKPTVVEAVQYTGTVESAHELKLLSDGSPVTWLGKSGVHTWNLGVVHAGEWIVTHGDGTQTIELHDTFTREYEPIETNKQPCEGG